MDPLVLARFVHFTATVTAAGTLWFALLMAAPAPALDRRLRRLAWAALAVSALSGAVWLVLLASDILGAPLVDVCLQGGVWLVLTDTRFGQVAAMRLGLIVALAALLPWPRTRTLQAFLAAALVALPALTGHAGAAPGGTVYGAVAADMVHLLAAAAWLGGLPAFALMLAASGPDVVRTTRRFATVAAVSVAALFLTGLINSWSLLGAPGDLIATDYGKVLLLKVGLFLAVLVIAAVNRFRLTPQLPAPAARRALTRNTLAESGLGIGILLLVGVLGTLVPGGHVHPEGAIPDGAAFVHIHGAEAMADLTIDPGRAGIADATLHVAREDFTEFPAREVRIELDPPATGGQAIALVAVRQPDGRWRAPAIKISHGGVWTARVIVTPEAGPDFMLDAPVVIAR